PPRRSIAVGRANSAPRRISSSLRRRRSSLIAANDSGSGVIEQDPAGLLAAIVSSSTDAIVSKDLEGRITSWNAGAERIFGYSAVEAMGQLVTIVLPPDKVDEEFAMLARIGHGERFEHFETVRQRKD